MPLLDVGFGLHTVGRGAVDDTEYASSLLCFGHNHLERIGGGAIDRTYLRNVLDAREDVDGVAVAQRDDEDVPGRDGGGVAGGHGLEVGVVAIDASETRAGCLVERDAELHLRYGVHHRLVEVLDSLDEMCLPDDEITVLGDLDRNRLQLHNAS